MSRAVIYKSMLEKKKKKKKRYFLKLQTSTVGRENYIERN